jgi:uncharacterized zinc-type alcohol dehydrogenase-like protein
MLDFAARHGSGAEIETLQVGEIDAALDHVRSGRPRYRVVLEM